MASSQWDPKARGLAPETESRETVGAQTQEAESQQELHAHGHQAAYDSASDARESDNEKSARSSLSHWDPEPGFAHIDGDAGGGHGYNDTDVDIVAVPCIGASPVDTWAREPLGDEYFDVASPEFQSKYQTIRELPGRAILSPTINRPLPKASPLWIRQGIRKEINAARVMLYRHRELTEGYTLNQAADDLLEQLSEMRAGLPKSRPIFFVCHSIGGLVAKLALVKASRIEELRPLVFDCHGMTFFCRFCGRIFPLGKTIANTHLPGVATPHRGSSYMSMPHLRESIQHLLDLQKPLPRSITEELRLGYRPLLRIHDQFTDIASELRIWTFYETVDSQLSGFGSSDFEEVHFSAPLVSIKSSIIGTRAEQAFSLESDHATCASFGSNNLQTMHSYLIDLRQAVKKAQDLSANYVHTPLRLNEKVKLELIGFYEDPDSDTHQDVRLYISKHLLKEFLEKGPERCLHERLNTVASKPQKGTPSTSLSRKGTQSHGFGVSALGIMHEFGQRFFSQAGGSPSATPPKQSDTQSPEIVVTSHPPRPSISGAASEPPPTATTWPRRNRGLTVPSLATPGYHRSWGHNRSRGGSEDMSRTLSDPGGSEISPKSIDDKRRETAESIVERDALPGIDERDPAAAVKSRRERLSKASAFQDLTAGFSRPDPSRRKFMWIHLPFNNPHWVKVSQMALQIQFRVPVLTMEQEYF